ncbi:Na-translocating system protein MpsC family protein [Neobacillus mesonae]|uniref:Na-translocating system protein MpsC family protein n=1 Tax=Neobacillus mesonae TaxID=1193713 RepID=UPI00203B2F41|nr:Na-translocating system protein MpsC family protein [Neobacillus mesonae]MCM3568028.1 DUF2294 domain-containing protein [Neobacillus mesonae]
METNVKQQEVSSYIGKLLRDNFGKGPESVYVSINNSIITMYLRNFITPMENVLMARDEEKTVMQTRDMLMQSLIPEIKAYVKIVTGLDIKEFYYDWNLHNKSGIFTGICSELFKDEDLHDFTYPGKERIHKEISDVSLHAQKVPDEIVSILLNPRTLIVIRNGILVSIEKELIRLGYRETLKIAKRNLEKTLLHNNHNFESILNTKVLDIFIDWDLQLDRSSIVFILKPIG